MGEAGGARGTILRSSENVRTLVPFAVAVSMAMSVAARASGGAFFAYPGLAEVDLYTDAAGFVSHPSINLGEVAQVAAVVNRTRQAVPGKDGAAVALVGLGFSAVSVWANLRTPSDCPRHTSPPTPFH